MSEIVKTFRVIRTELKVGDTERQYGDFVPEASEWKNRHAYLRGGYIEECYVSQDAIDKNMQEIKSRPKNEDVVYDTSETPSPVSDDEPEFSFPPVLDHADPDVVKASATSKPKVKSSKKSVKIKKSKKTTVRSSENGDEGREASGEGSEGGAVLAEVNV
jgi:hypothetical protein